MLSRLTQLNTRYFLLLSFLGVSFLLLLGVFGSYLTIAPIFKLIRQCSQLLTIPIVYRIGGLFAGGLFILWLTNAIRYGKRQKKMFQGFREKVILTEELPEILKETAEEMGLLRKLFFVSVDLPLAFTYGFFKPRIVISEGLVKVLEPAELKAVLLHEKYHVLKKDPLKIFILRALFNNVFPLGLINRLIHSFSVTMELRADKYSQKGLGVEQQFLASALLKLIHFEATPPQFAVGITSVLDARIEQCLNPKWLPESMLKRQDWAVLGGYVAFLVAALYIAITYNQSFVSASCHPTYLCHLTYL